MIVFLDIIIYFYGIFKSFSVLNNFMKDTYIKNKDKLFKDKIIMCVCLMVTIWSWQKVRVLVMMCISISSATKIHFIMANTVIYAPIMSVISTLCLFLSYKIKK